MPQIQPSPKAANDLKFAVEQSLHLDAQENRGITDCLHGCTVADDGVCEHGFESAALTAGMA